MRLILFICALSLSLPVQAESYSSIMERRPDLFDSESGYRVARQRSPTPDDIPPPAIRIGVTEVEALMRDGAVLLDVFGAQVSRFDELDGTWLVSGTRKSLPGAVWLPEVGRGRLSEEMDAYLVGNIKRLRDREQAVVVFCVADCWMSWNAAQRISAAGFAPVYWFREGTDGWRDAGLDLVPVNPVPVGVE